MIMTNPRNTIGFFQNSQLTDVEDLSESEDDSRSDSYNYLRMADNTLTYYQEKENLEVSEEEENTKKKTSARWNMSDLELSDYEDEGKDYLEMLEVMSRTGTDVEQLSSEDENGRTEWREKSEEQPLEVFEATEEEEFSEEEVAGTSKTEANVSDKWLTVKNGLGKTIPKIVISHIWYGDEETEETPKANKKLARQRNKTNSKKEDSKTERSGKKYLKKQKQALEEVSDSEDIYLKPLEKKKRKKRGRREKEVVTEVEDLEQSSESSFVTEEPRAGPTDTEEFLGSSEEEEEESPATRSSVSDEESTVNIQTRIRSDWDSPEEVLNWKNFTEQTEVHTDVEHVDISENENRRNSKEKTKVECYGSSERAKHTSKTKFSSFVGLGGWNELVQVCCLENQMKKPKNGRPRTKEWSEKGQSEEFAYETKDLTKDHSSAIPRT